MSTHGDGDFVKYYWSFDKVKLAKYIIGIPLYIYDWYVLMTFVTNESEFQKFQECNNGDANLMRLLSLWRVIVSTCNLVVFLPVFCSDKNEVTCWFNRWLF